MHRERWLGLSKVHWEDPHGKRRVWEAVTRTTGRPGSVDGTLLQALVMSMPINNTWCCVVGGNSRGHHRHRATARSGGPRRRHLPVPSANREDLPRDPVRYAYLASGGVHHGALCMT